MKYYLKPHVTDESEYWKPIIGFEERYLISNKGRIYSLTKNVVLKYQINNGYNMVTLKNRFKFITKKVSRIVATHFIENTQNKLEVNHKNGIKNDDTVENLEWVTRSENQRHKIDVLGYKVPQSMKDKQKLVRGDKHPQSKLSEKQVFEIKKAMLNGARNKDLAEKYNVHKNYISRIRTGICWKWLEVRND